MLLKRFNEFIINEEKKDDGIHVDSDRLKIVNKRKKFINQKWVCLIVTDKTSLDFEINYMGGLSGDSINLITKLYID